MHQDSLQQQHHHAGQQQLLQQQQLQQQHQGHPQQQQVEQERLRKLGECETELGSLYEEFENIKKDIAEARTNKQPTGPLFTEKQRIEDKIKTVQRDVKQYRDTEGASSIPNLKENQFAIGTSVVRRKNASEIKKN